MFIKSLGGGGSGTLRRPSLKPVVGHRCRWPAAESRQRGGRRNGASLLARWTCSNKTSLRMRGFLAARRLSLRLDSSHADMCIISLLSGRLVKLLIAFRHRRRWTCLMLLGLSGKPFLNNSLMSLRQQSLSEAVFTQLSRLQIDAATKNTSTLNLAFIERIKMCF